MKTNLFAAEYFYGFAYYFSTATLVFCGKWNVITEQASTLTSPILTQAERLGFYEPRSNMIVVLKQILIRTVDNL